MKSFASLSLAILFVGAAIVQTAVQANEAPGKTWPSWRGPDKNGAAPSGDYAVKFSGEEGLAWKVKLPGKGCSTPIVWDGKIILTTPAEGRDTVLALDWNGKELWHTALGREDRGKHKNGSGSNPSPITDGSGIYVHFKSGRVAALEMDGSERWQDNVVEKYGPFKLYWDQGTSPVLTEKYVVQAVMNQRSSYLVAFDKKTGKVAWKVDRHYNLKREGDESYASPIVTTLNGKEVIIVWGGEHLDAHDPADGSKLWSCGGFNPNEIKNWVHVASPVLIGDMAIVPFGRRKGETVSGVKMGGSGDITASNVVWKRTDRGTFVTTPVVYGDNVIIVSGVQSRKAGRVTCLDPKTGKTVWEHDLQERGGEFYSSPIVAGGKLYAARIDGTVFVAQLDGGFKVLSENAMGERIIAAPVAVNNRILIRGESSLFCVAEPGK